MSSRSPSCRLRLWLAAVAFLVLLGRAPAQTPAAAPVATSPPATFDLAKASEPNLVLNGPWRFQFGDDPDGRKGWASPGFDDSDWPLIRVDRSWSEQGVKDKGGSLWYRASLLIPPGTRPLGLYIRYIAGSYQVFADGQLLATEGWLPPHPRSASGPSRTVFLPASDNAGAHTVLLAIRVWADPREAAFQSSGLRAGSRVGSAAAMQSRLELTTAANAWDRVDAVLLSVLETLGGMAALALFAFRRREKEYLWFGVFLLLSALEREVFLSSRFHVLDLVFVQETEKFLEGAKVFASIFFYGHLLAARRNWPFWIATASCSVFSLAVFADKWTSAQVKAIEITLFVPFFVWAIALVSRRAMQGRPDARLLLIPILAMQLGGTMYIVVDISAAYGWTNGMPAWFEEPVHWPFAISADDLMDALFLLAMLAILIYRFTRTRLHEEIFEREREAARTVQQVLIPEDIPTIPGFLIGNAYRPFGEVGGDFFQILPCEGSAHPGSVLIAIGDVSGKGLPAAMTVSLLVGTLRTLAQYTQAPGEILSVMNTRLSGRNNGGFTTCLVVRAEPDGSLLIANAGHLSPYCDGAEIIVPSGLPLGLDPNAEYTEFTFRLEGAAQLTLLTDGVVEARSKTGELFGFDRAESVTRESAESIAQTAQTFGQDDDITVVTLKHVFTMAKQEVEHSMRAG